MDVKYYEKIRSLIDKRDKQQILKEACSELRFTSKTIGQYSISIITSIILGFLISHSIDTISIMREIVGDLNGIMLALIAVVFGSYSIFQALISGELVVLLIKAKNNLLKESNKTFLNLTILYVAAIFINFVLSVILKVLPDDFVLVSNLKVCNILAWIGSAVYLFIQLILFLEMINFAINMYRMFCVYNSLTAIDALETEEDKENNED